MLCCCCAVVICDLKRVNTVYTVHTCTSFIDVVCDWTKEMTLCTHPHCEPPSAFAAGHSTPHGCPMHLSFSLLHRWHCVYKCPSAACSWHVCDCWCWPNVTHPSLQYLQNFSFVQCTFFLFPGCLCLGRVAGGIELIRLCWDWRNTGIFCTPFLGLGFRGFVYVRFDLKLPLALLAIFLSRIEVVITWSASSASASNFFNYQWNERCVHTAAKIKEGDVTAGAV